MIRKAKRRMQSATARADADARGELDRTRSHRDLSPRYHAPKIIEKTTLHRILETTGREPSLGDADLLGAREQSLTPDLTLYYSGKIELLRTPCVAVVGTRDVTDEGGHRTMRLVRELIPFGVTIVSGLARGVDAIAHNNAMMYGGRTIGVIGTPLNKATPVDNSSIQEKIWREHLLISQFPEGSSTWRGSFPLRNRLMALISDATVVMEASDTSGTLHQAAECTRVGRWLFIAKSVVDDPDLTWPKKFLRYKTCVPLVSVTDITSRLGLARLS